MSEKQRWAYFVGVAVERFEKCVLALDADPALAIITGPGIRVGEEGDSKPEKGSRRRDFVLPPIDVLLVWHAYLLNPL